MSTHKQCNVNKTEILLPLLVLHRFYFQFLFHHYLGFFYSYCHKLESESKCFSMQRILLFALPNLHTVIYHLHCNHSQNLEIHARIIKCLLSLSLSLPYFIHTNVMNCVHHIIRNQFDSIQFNSNFSLNSTFCFPWKWTVAIAAAEAEEESSHFVCCHTMSANIHTHKAQTQHRIHIPPIASFIRFAAM